MILTYAIAIAVVLGLCVLGLSIGLILRGKGLQSCGRAALGGAHGNISCPACSGKDGECRKEKVLGPAVSTPGREPGRPS
jgi:hypothetical protein